MVSPTIDLDAARVKAKVLTEHARTMEIRTITETQGAAVMRGSTILPVRKFGMVKRSPKSQF
jgi:hypothetical protein